MAVGRALLKLFPFTLGYFDVQSRPSVWRNESIFDDLLRITIYRDTIYAMKNDNPRGLGRFGEPATLILLSLASGPKHGYAIMQDVEEQMGVKLGPGTLYGAIGKLIKWDMIRALPTEDRARPYEIAPKGREAVIEFLRAWAPIIHLGEKRLA